MTLIQVSNHSLYATHLPVAMPVIISAKHAKNPSITVNVAEQTRKMCRIWASFVTHFWTNDLEYIGQDHKPLCGPWEFKGDWLVCGISKVQAKVYIHVWRVENFAVATYPEQGSTLSFLAGCPKSHFLGWYRNFLVYWYLKQDNQVVNTTCPKDKLSWIWRADDP